MRLTKNSYIQERMHVHSIVYGCGQSIDHMIIRVIAFRLARNGVHSSKNLAIVISSNLKRLEPWASKKACIQYHIEVKGHICAYTQNAPNSEYLGQENGMRLITNNMRL